MPVITIKIGKGRSIEKKRALVEAMTKVVVETLDVKPEWVTILLDEYERENWATAGQLHADTLGPGCGKAGVKG